MNADFVKCSKRRNTWNKINIRAYYLESQNSHTILVVLKNSKRLVLNEINVHIQCRDWFICRNHVTRPLNFRNERKYIIYQIWRADITRIVHKKCHDICQQGRLLWHSFNPSRGFSLVTPRFYSCHGMRPFVSSRDWLFPFSQMFLFVIGSLYLAICVTSLDWLLTPCQTCFCSDWLLTLCQV